MNQKREKNQKAKPSCGVVRPISSNPDNMHYPMGHWEEVQSILEEALSDNFTVQMVSDAEETGVLPVRIIKNLYTSDLVICDISQRNPNVMFELGVRIAFDKPVIIISDECSKAPFDTAHIEYISYPSDLNYYKIQQFKEQLSEKAKCTFQAGKENRISLLSELGNIQPFKFNENLPKNDQFSEFATEMFANIRLLRREISDIQDNLMLMRRNKNLPQPYLFPPLSYQDAARLLIKKLSVDENFKKDIANIGITEMVQRLKTMYPNQLAMIPNRMLVDIIQRECLN